MVVWILVPCLNALFEEFNRIAPDRDRASDGSIGDTAHQGTVSDHNPDETGAVPIHDADKANEVHAIDVDKDLRESDLTMEKVIQFLLARCRAGTEKRLRYIIYNRRIWSASSGWVQKTYTGANPHDKHAHFSASYSTVYEANTTSWHLEDIPVALTTEDKKWLTNIITTEVHKVAAGVWAELLGSPPGSAATKWPAENMARNTYNEAKAAHVTAQSALEVADQILEKLTATPQ